jgi:calcium permeable stress-gated cation channel
VFLVTALASSGSAVVTQIISDPGSATGLLANNLPKSSNFYICYLLLQGLSIAGGALLQIVGLILFYLLGKLFDNTPRKMWTRWNMLSGLGWGTVFPIYTNLAVIAITYSLMSPLILIFAAGAFGLLYFAYLHNFLYVYSQSVDTGGMVFPRAIWQSFTGIYILEVCMTGLYGIRTAFPELVLMAVTIPITAVYQVLLQWKIEKKLEYLDVTDDDLEAGDGKDVGSGTPTDEKGSPILGSGSNAGGMPTTGNQGTGAGVAPTGATPGIGGSAGNQAVDAVADQLAIKNAKGPQRGQSGMNDYHHPAVAAPVPVVWIPQDPLGISKEEIRDTEAAGDIKITDGGANMDEKAKMAWTEDPPDYEP